MEETRVIYYDVDAPESVAARAAVRAPLLVLADGHDRGVIQSTDVELFNIEFNELLVQAQKDPSLAVRFFMELVRAVDHAARTLASTSGRQHAAVIHHFLPT